MTGARRERGGRTSAAWQKVWNYAFPQELQHLVDCVLGHEQPLETGEDGRAVLEIILAAYESAATARSGAGRLRRLG